MSLIHPEYYTKHDIVHKNLVITPINLFDSYGFILGNVGKYLLRFADKNQIEDLNKALTYLKSDNIFQTNTSTAFDADTQQGLNILKLKLKEKNYLLRWYFALADKEFGMDASGKFPVGYYTLVQAISDKILDLESGPTVYEGDAAYATYTYTIARITAFLRDYTNKIIFSDDDNYSPEVQEKVSKGVASLAYNEIVTPSDHFKDKVYELTLLMGTTNSNIKDLAPLIETSILETAYLYWNSLVCYILTEYTGKTNFNIPNYFDGVSKEYTKNTVNTVEFIITDTNYKKELLAKAIETNPEILKDPFGMLVNQYKELFFPGANMFDILKKCLDEVCV